MSAFFTPWWDPVDIKEQSIDTVTLCPHPQTLHELSACIRVPPWQQKEQGYSVAGHHKQLGFDAVSPGTRMLGWYGASGEQYRVSAPPWRDPADNLTSYGQFGGISTKCEPEDPPYHFIQYKVDRNYQWNGNNRPNWTDSDVDSTRLGTPALTIASTLPSPMSGQSREISLEFFSRQPSHDASYQHEDSSKTLPSVRSLLPGFWNPLPPAQKPNVPWAAGPGIEPLDLGAPAASTASDNEDDNESLASSWATSESSEYSDLESSDSASETSEVSNHASDVHEVSTRERGTDIQIGHARLRIRVEILSLSRLPNEESDVDGFDHDISDGDDNGGDYSDSSFGNNNRTNSPNDNDGEGRARNQTGSGGAVHPPERPSASGLSGRRKRHMDQNDDQENDEHDDRRKRSRRRSNSPDLTMASNTPRFACPYQVYEPLLDCLRRGPRNPKGGCEGISRLKYENYTAESSSRR